MQNAQADKNEAKNAQAQQQQEVAYEHKDEDGPNMEKMKKLKSEIKRLRQELIMKPNGSGNANNWDIGQDDSFTEEQKQ